MHNYIENIKLKCNTFWAAKLGCYMYRTTVFFNLAHEPAVKRTASLCSVKGYYTELQMMEQFKVAMGQMARTTVA